MVGSLFYRGPDKPFNCSGKPCSLVTTTTKRITVEKKHQCSFSSIKQLYMQAMSQIASTNQCDISYCLHSFAAKSGRNFVVVATSKFFKVTCSKRLLLADFISFIAKNALFYYYLHGLTFYLRRVCSPQKLCKTVPNSPLPMKNC